jgi:glycosyltransferase involved in cell wall biosynthesis
MLAAKGHQVLIVGPEPRKPSVRQWAKALLGRATLPAAPEQSHYARAEVPIHVIGHHGPVRLDDVPDADVIIATFWTTAEWVMALPRQKGAKVHFIQGYEDFPGVPVDRLEAVWRLPTYKIAIAQWLVDLGRERFGIDNIALVTNSIDHHIFKPTERDKGQRPTVGFLYSGASFKDIPTSIRALERLKEMVPDVTILSFGAVRPEPGQLPPWCEFHHLPSQDEIVRIHLRCHAWLSTSQTEGFNLPPLEAMASGCPAVCSKTGRPLEIILNGVNGYLVDQGDFEGFANALSKILSLSNDAWRSMSQAAIDAVAHPTWEESSKLFEEALMESVAASV